MIILYAILTILAALLIKYGLEFINYRKTMNQLPGVDDFHPLLGNLHTYPGYKEDGIEWIYEQAKKYKYFHRFWFGPLKCNLWVYHPEVIKEIMKKSIKPLDSGLLMSDYDVFVPWLGNGLVTSNGPHWHRNRRLLTPSFHFDVLKTYLTVYNSCADVLLDKIGHDCKDNSSLNIEPLLGKYTTDIILRCAFSLCTNIQTESGPNEYMNRVNEIVALGMKRYLNPLHHNDFIYKHLTSDGRKFHKLCKAIHEYSENIIKERQREIEINQNLDEKPRDFLDTIIRAKDEEGTGLSLEDMRSEVNTFMFAGHDTTWGGTMWTLLNLATHQEHQQQVYEEICQVTGEREEIIWEDLGKLKFTTQCIKEAMRIHTPVPVVNRMTTEGIEFEGHKIPSGTEITLDIYGLHLNPHVWDEPLKYKPERFDPDNAANMAAFQYIPFSAGARNCIGQNFAMNEMKLTLSRIIKRFHIKPDQEKPALREIGATLKAQNGVFFFFTPRA